MLLERIDIDAFGSLERIQLGPFSHRLNAIFGPQGSGKSSTLEFVRSVMLGTDQQWYEGASGRLVWANHDGILHCRREADGTPRGRLMVDFQTRDGRPYDHQYGYRTAESYQRLERLIDIPKSLVEAVVAPDRNHAPEHVAAACYEHGLLAQSWLHDEQEILRVRADLETLERQLNAFENAAEARQQLQKRRQELSDHLDHLRRVESPPQDDHRERWEARLHDLRDEVTRLRTQESDLRRSLARIDAELQTLPAQQLPHESLAVHNPANSAVNLSASHRSRLQSLDQQLIRLSGALEEIRNLREDWNRLDASDLLTPGEITRYYPAANRPDRFERYRRRLESLRQQLDLLVDLQRPADQVPSWSPDGRWHGEALLDAITKLIGSLDASNDYATRDGRLYEDELALSERVILDAFQQVLKSRGDMLDELAAEFGLPANHLHQAFGDWTHCHQHPHVYDWLLNRSTDFDRDDSQRYTAQRRRLLAEQRELIDELNRTANRLDNGITETRLLEQRIADMPVFLPVVVDQRQRDSLQRELADVERQLHWLDSHEALREQHRKLRQHLDHLLGGSLSQQAVVKRARFWLEQIAGDHAAQANSLLQAILKRARSGATTAVDPSPKSSVTRNQVALALRMATAEQMKQQGTQIPLLIDELYPHWLGDSSLSRMAQVFHRFSEAGHQTIVLTAQQGLAEAIRAAGGKRLDLTPGRFYQIRYRDAAPRWPHNVNRELDTIWRENQGVYDDPHWYRQTLHTEHTNSPQTPPARSSASSAAASPFFLTEDSPVDQAPSIDAVAADRLRCIEITKVGDLLAADPDAVARRLQLADVSPVVVRRWQDEAHLVCGVPQLRNFDARVLVGCGFTDPGQLARMHPGLLLEKVEAFLATDRGQQILRTGTSYELSRITSWIAAANRSVARDARHGSPRARRLRSTASSNYQPVRLTKNRRPQRDIHEGPHRPDEQDPNHSTGDRNPRASRSRQSRGTPHRQPTRGGDRFRATTAAADKSAASATAQINSAPTHARLEFYLHLDSHIVDAPSIGPKMASRLEHLGYRSVRQFLYADPEEIAEGLNLRRITGEKIQTWQRQSRLMCQVPQLRGHDAQLLVAVDIDEPAQLGACDAHWLLREVTRVAESSAGKRILRGGKKPDLAEVQDWIGWANQRRSLQAA